MQQGNHETNIGELNLQTKKNSRQRNSRDKNALETLLEPKENKERSYLTPATMLEP
jgi:hypothetical protein